ncbi:MAG: transcription-repair coupling factor [Hyphomicrobiaceae bacterium]
MAADARSAREFLLTGVPEGLDALVLARIAASAGPEVGGTSLVLHVARDDRRLEALHQALAFFAPKLRVIAFPAWDTVPYDRVTPQPDIVAQRISALARMLVIRPERPTIVLTTVSAVLQRVPPRDAIRRGVRQVAPGQRLDMARLVSRLDRSGYVRTGSVMEPGEFAVRGGILDLYPPARSQPVRLDFFGDTLESIKSFDAETQRTQRPVPKLVLLPVSELAFNPEAEALFRARYIELFGPVTSEDPLYEAVSQGRRFPGAEHWLPLFHETLETLFDYLPGAALSFDHMGEEAVRDRLELVADHYEARVQSLETLAFGSPPYKPVPTSLMFIEPREWAELLAARYVLRFSPFAEVPGRPTVAVVPQEGRLSRNFAADRAGEGANVFDSVAGHVRSLQERGRRVLIAAWSNGARERLGSLLAGHGLATLAKVENFDEVEALPPDKVALGVLGLEHGFETASLAVIGEQDILGDRLVRPRKIRKKASDVLTEATSLSVGDLVVHADHGIGRFSGLTTVTALGAPHDCLEIVYHGGDKLLLPVENIEMLSRYGADEGSAQLDRLGGSAWQSRKARLKKRLREIAGELLKIAALRQVRQAPVLAPEPAAVSEFAARFAHEETEDQDAAIAAVLDDLQSGRPMDRLICGDVGFGKTEVALRAAFAAVMSGKQVAVVVPTTLLARQHYKTFRERFRGLPVRIAQASRLTTAKELAETKVAIREGRVDIVVGTHALLGKTIAFADLGLLIIDEEQHFGVQHKERLKHLREDVHVLTLTATPIPRTLQLALSGVRELSLITTPPVDRLAVRTFVTPFDPVIIKDALMRERFRGGQTFYVVPRIADLEETREFLSEIVPDLRLAQAHGQLAASELEDVMSAFYDGKYDILLSTAIVESGLDIPNANTLIVHRADMFGLAQLYQLRGRVGRSKTRAYAYFTTPANMRLTEGAEKRLKVLQSLDTLGAGFSLASHDLDIRGAGNLLGEEQSGHIREVGFELYQSMLEETIAQLKGGVEEGQDQWSPQIGLGMAILIPDTYVADLPLRLGLYRRLSTLTTRSDIEAFADELVDRFGALPPEVQHLLDVVEIKAICKTASIAQLDAGPKGAVVRFHKNTFANPDGLVRLAVASRGAMKLQPDHKVVLRADWETDARKIAGVRKLVKQLADTAQATP